MDGEGGDAHDGAVCHVDELVLDAFAVADQDTPSNLQSRAHSDVMGGAVGLRPDLQESTGGHLIQGRLGMK